MRLLRRSVPKQICLEQNCSQEGFVLMQGRAASFDTAANFTKDKNAAEGAHRIVRRTQKVVCVSAAHQLRFARGLRS
jgi:hypothetical protein